MGEKTTIAWCDSTGNLQQGCDGCELWIPKQNIKKCYAGLLTERYAGQKGWVKAFDKPEVFPERINQIVKWSDLTGKERMDKPWLNGLPRIVFLDDMGDTFTKGLDENWLDPFIAPMEQSPHIYMFLTKRPSAMARYFFDHLGRVPSNFALGVTATNYNTERRIGWLYDMKKEFPDIKTFVSAEPLWTKLDWIDAIAACVDLIIIGGESGVNPEPMPYDDEELAGEIEWLREQGAKVFVKQMGSVWAKKNKAKDRKGEDWNDWHQSLRVREFPEWRK